MGIVFQYEYGMGTAVDVVAKDRAEADVKARERVVAVFGDAFRPEALTYVGTADVLPATVEREVVCTVRRSGRGSWR